MTPAVGCLEYYYYAPDQLEQKSIQEKLDVLMMKLGEMEVEMHQLSESKYVHFKPYLFTANSLAHRVHEVQSEMSAIEEKVHTEVSCWLRCVVSFVSPRYVMISLVLRVWDKAWWEILLSSR